MDSGVIEAAGCNAVKPRLTCLRRWTILRNKSD